MTYSKWDERSRARARDPVGKPVKPAAKVHFMPKLDRIPYFDPRSREHPVSEVLPRSTTALPTYKLWRLDERNDQGQEGACVGFGVGHRLAAAPLEVSGIDAAWSHRLYKEAQKIDPWPGENYEGTAVLAGIKVSIRMGHVYSYRWCFSLEDYIKAVLLEGPVLVGTNWMDSMWDPDPDTHILDCRGEVSGGHCYIIRGVNTRLKKFRITNSWGKDWGYNGDASITFADWQKYMMPEGEGAVLFEKKVGELPPAR